MSRSLTPTNAHVTLQNTTTLQQYRFRTQLPRPTHRLPPGSYKVIYSSAQVPRDIYFKGNFNVFRSLSQKDAITISPYVPLTSVSPFNIKNPNYLVVSNTAPNGAQPIVSLSSIYDVDETWDVLNNFLLQLKEYISDTVLLFLNAILEKNLEDTTKYATMINDKMTQFCTDMETVTGWSPTTATMLNTESLVRCSNDSSKLGTYEIGQTEIMTAQQDPTTIANDMSSSSSSLYYKAAISLASFQQNGQYPCLVLKLAIVL
jgi:hypothetical protein